MEGTREENEGREGAGDLSDDAMLYLY